MWLKWLPWRYVIKNVARGYGFVDPISLLAKLHRFGEPSEVAEPIELLRAGVVFHARGLVNTKAIQHNLDWVWPYWVEKQFNPLDNSFIPRAFSVTHVNLTHRNWTAIGVPDCEELPIVDPCGLLTPFWDSWSLDCWMVSDGGEDLIPSRNAEVAQRLKTSNGHSVETKATNSSLQLLLNAEVKFTEQPQCCLNIEASSSEPCLLVVSVRPYNPEGISFIHQIAIEEHENSWLVNGEHRIEFNERPQKQLLSDYVIGDVFSCLHTAECQKHKANSKLVSCDVGMATGAAVFEVNSGERKHVEVTVPLAKVNKKKAFVKPKTISRDWKQILEGSCTLSIDQPQYEYLWNSAVNTLVLLSPAEVYPGPFTYRRFWFRDAAFMLHALMVLGFVGRAEAVIDSFFEKQTHNGFFKSQEGEWDSNGLVLWIINRYCQLANKTPKPSWIPHIKKGADWIQAKRAESIKSEFPGFLPPGFSAEHLGPSDYYYWDDFWGIAGLYAAENLMNLTGDEEEAAGYRDYGNSFNQVIEQSFNNLRVDLCHSGIPASPKRRMDAGAIGSLVMGYPTQLWGANDQRLLSTTETILNDFFVNGAFFQDMIHSGMNPYLTLHVAQVLLRAGDFRFKELLKIVADLASPTGMWPEAIHPGTGGGCMGDGHHGWAAAEWILILRNCFVIEESDRLVIGAGITNEWLDINSQISFGPTPTQFGNVSVTANATKDEIHFEIVGSWYDEEPKIELKLPAREAIPFAGKQLSITVPR